MIRSHPFRVLPILLALALAGCSRAPGASGDRSRLAAEWTGSDTGRIAGRAVAEWCDSLRVLEIRAVKGDTGVALAIFPADTIKPDSYPAMRCCASASSEIDS